MGKPREKTLKIIMEAKTVLEESSPMTLRQLFYALVSRQIIDNTKGSYKAVGHALVYARQNDLISWDDIEDRLRRPRHVSMWDGLVDFAETASQAYRRNVWPTQSTYFEVWLEKDALSGIFEAILRQYGVTLNVGRGYDGWSSIYNAANRFGDGDDKAILYFGDFDPSGEDMVRSLRDRLAFFGSEPEITKSALTENDIEKYNLPPDFTKESDTRQAAFIEKFGDKAVELDALPLTILEERIEHEIRARMNIDALEIILSKENKERKKLKIALKKLK